MHHDISLPGVPSADLIRPEMPNLGQAAQDLKREKSRAFGPLYGKGDRTLGHEIHSMRRTNILGHTAPELQPEPGFGPALLSPGREIKNLDPVMKSSSLEPIDKQRKNLAVSQAQVRETFEPLVSERRGAASYGATPVAGGVRQQLPLDNTKSHGSAPSQAQSSRRCDSSAQQDQRAQNCGSTSDSSDVLEINRHELLGSETQRSQSLVPKPHDGKDGNLRSGDATPQAHEERTYRPPLSQTQDVRRNVFSLPQGQANRNYLSGVADRQGVTDIGLEAKDTIVPRIRGTVAVESRSGGSLNHQVQGGGSYGPVIPGTSGTQSLGLPSVDGQEGFVTYGQEAKHLSHAEVTKSKAVSIPGQAGRNTQATSKSKALSLYTITMSLFIL